MYRNILCIMLTFLFFNTLIFSQNKTSNKIETKTITYLSGTDSVNAYLAEPEGEGPFPGLIVIHEWWGLNNWVKRNADDFAKRGYVALAIDLYRGKSTDKPEVARKLMQSMSEDRAARDLKAAINELTNMKNVDKNRIGSIGWCMGGGYSLQAALNIPDLKACVINYGRLVTDKNLIEKINCPILGIFGQEDKGITPKDVNNFKQALNKAKIKNKIIDYPGVNHAFMNPNNKKGYNKKVTEKAWKETYDFLNKYLKNS